MSVYIHAGFVFRSWLLKWFSWCKFQQSLHCLLLECVLHYMELLFCFALLFVRASGSQLELLILTEVCLCMFLTCIKCIHRVVILFLVLSLILKENWCFWISVASLILYSVWFVMVANVLVSSNFIVVRWQ